MGKPEVPQIPLDPQFDAMRGQAEADKMAAIAERLRGDSASIKARYGAPADSASVLQRYGAQLAIAGAGSGSPLATRMG